MRYREENRYRMSRAKVALILLAFVAVYVLVILGVNIVGDRLEGKTEIEEPKGNLNGRFENEIIKLDYDSREWVYRGRELTNVLFIGIDWTQMDEPKEAHYRGQADFLLLLSLDKRNNTVSYIQIDRDTIAPIRIYSPFGAYVGIEETQICLSQAFGETRRRNCENTAWSVSRLMDDIPIDYYIAMDLGGITALNDALGGVTVTLEDDFTAQDPDMVQGATITLKGKQAEIYVRSRLNIGDGENASRMRRQRQYLTNVIEIISNGIREDLNFASDLYDQTTEHLVSNVSRGRLLNKVYETRDYTHTDVRALIGRREIDSDGYMTFIPDEESLHSLTTELFFR